MEDFPKCPSGDEPCIIHSFKHIVQYGHGKCDSKRNSSIFIQMVIRFIQIILSLFEYHFDSFFLEYSELNSVPLNPFKPRGAHDSFAVKIIDSGLGINVDGVASKISVYGFDQFGIQQLEYVNLTMYKDVLQNFI